MRGRKKRRRAGLPEMESFPSWKQEILRAVAHLVATIVAPSGECCHWVLDVVLQTVEWLSQPLGFESLTLRRSLDAIKPLDNVAVGVMLKVFEGQRPVPDFSIKPRLTIGALVFLGSV